MLEEALDYAIGNVVPPLVYEAAVSVWEQMLPDMDKWTV